MLLLAFLKIPIWGGNQRHHTCDLLEQTWRLKRRHTRKERESLNGYTGLSSESAAFSGWLFFCLTLCKEEIMQKQSKLLGGWFSFASCAFHIWSSGCLFVAGKTHNTSSTCYSWMEWQFTHVCTVNVIQLTEWHSRKFQRSVLASRHSYHVFVQETKLLGFNKQVHLCDGPKKQHRRAGRTLLHEV